MEEAEDGEILDSIVEFDPISDEEDTFSIQGEDIQDNVEYERMKQRILELEQRNLELEKIASVQTFDVDYANPLTEEYEVDEFANKKAVDKKQRHSDHRPARKKWVRSPSPILSRRRSRSPNFHVMHCDRMVVLEKKRRRSTSPNFRRHVPIATPFKHHTNKHRKTEKHTHKCNRATNGVEKVPLKRKKSKRLATVAVPVHRLSSESPEPEFEINHRRKLDAALKRDSNGKKPTNVLKNKLQNIMMKDKKVAVVEKPTAVDPPDEDDEVLKLRLLALKSKQEVKELIVEDELTKTMNGETKREDSTEEQELRLIALKSAYLKKHNARKLRKENEQPYSPTDDIAFAPLPNISLETTDIVKTDDMEISPLASPTPTTQCEPIDMELESGDSNEMPNQSPEPAKFPPDKHDYFFNGAWPLPMPVPIIPVPFPVVAMCSTDPIKAEPVFVPKIRKSSTNDEDIKELADILNVNLESPENLTPNNGLATPPIEPTKAVVAAPSATAVEDDEEALRTMLLSSVRKKLEVPKSVVTEPAVQDMDASVEAENLRCLLLSSMRNKSPPVLTRSEAVSSPEINLKKVAERIKQTEKAAKVEEKTSQQNEVLRKALEKLKQAKVESPVKVEKVLTVKEPVPVEKVPIVLPAPVGKEATVKVQVPLEEVPIVKVPAPVEKEPTVKVQVPVEKEPTVKVLGPVVMNKQVIVPQAPEQTIPKVINRTVIATSSTTSKAPAAKRKIAKVLPRTTDATKKVVVPKTAPTVKPQLTKRPSPAKKLKIAPPSKPNPPPSNNKITNVDKIIKPVPKLVINLGLHSDSDSDYDDDANDDGGVAAFRDLDNQSPSHIMIGSPAAADKLAGAPTADVGKASFDMKLDAFLKNVRSKVEQISTLESSRVKTNKAPTGVKVQTAAVPTTQKTVPKTPLAVRHLPHSTQLEYKRLIQRMNQLEKQKAKAKANPPKKPSPPAATVPTTSAPTVPQPTEPEVTTNLKITINNEVVTTPPPATSPVLKITLKDKGRQVKESEELQKVVDVTEKSPRFTDTLRKQILLKNALAKNAEPIANQMTMAKANAILEKVITPLKPVVVKVPKKAAKSIAERINAWNTADRSKFLAKYESNYEANSKLFLNDLDKIIGTISEAKIERHKQFQLENEVEEMRAKLKILEDQLDLQKKSVSKLLPSISESHKALLTSRTKCTQLSAVCVKVGKIVQGPSYQLSNDRSKAIGDRLKGLAGEIRKLKSMNRESVKKEEVINVPDTLVKQEPVPNNDDDQIEIIEVPVPVIVIPDSPCKAEPIQKSPNPSMLEQIDVPPEAPQPSIATKYKSPLDFLHRKGATPHVEINPDSVLCPFQMNGRCEDETCTYQHFS